MSVTAGDVAKHMRDTFEARIAARREGNGRVPVLPPDVADAIGAITSSDGPKPLVALTLLATKSWCPEVSAAQIQGGAVDYRSLYSKHLRAVLQEVIEGLNIKHRLSQDAFVSNPYRERVIDEEWLSRRRKPEAERDLLTVVEFVDSAPSSAADVFGAFVEGLIDHLEDARVAYPIPSRITVRQVMEILTEFLEPVSGGSRMERVAVSLLRFVGPLAGWERVEGHATNDQLPYDAECHGDEGLEALAESKDQPVDLIHLRQLVEEMRRAGVHRGFFFTHNKHLPTDPNELRDYVQAQHLLGERIEVLDILATAQAWLVLGDRYDPDLPRFLQVLADELDTWATLGERQDFSRILSRL